MPEVCRFYGIIIRMFWDDHPPPHFHASYGEYEALIEIESGEIFAGALPLRARSLVNEWVELHRAELFNLWKSASQSKPLTKIDPLP
jgi:hypothetical protein